jgi:tetratricopeptide (TPR) repeat protein
MREFRMLRGSSPILAALLLSFVPAFASAQEAPEVVSIPRTVEVSDPAEAELTEEEVAEEEVAEEEVDGVLAAAIVFGRASTAGVAIAARNKQLPTTDELFADEPGARVAKAVAAATDATPKTRTFELPDSPATAALLQTVKQKALQSLRSIDRIRTVFAVPQVNLDNYFVLAPHVDDPRWLEAMNLLVDDKCVDARKKAEAVVGPTENLDENADPAVRYALARIDLCGGQNTRGQKVLKELAQLDDAVGDLAKLRLGLRISRKGEDTRYVSDYLRDAKSRARKGEVNEALADLDRLYKELPGRWDKFRARREQAEILEEAKRYDDAGEVYVALYRKTRGWKVNASIEDRIERLERKTNTNILTYGERIDRMRHLIARGRYGDARKQSVANAKLKGVSGNEIRGWSFYRRALVAEKKKDREEAAKMFEQAERLVKDTEVRPRLYFGWARALRRLDQDRKAIELYERL